MRSRIVIPSPERSSFVVVGAHEFGGAGEANDDMLLLRLAADHAWGGVLLVEASPLLANRLAARLAQSPAPFNRTHPSRIRVSNIGVVASRVGSQQEGSGEGTMPFFSPTARMLSGDQRLPSFADQFGSFNRTHVEHHLRGVVRYMRRHYGSNHSWTAARLASTIAKHDVTTRTLADELQRHRLPPPAVLLIDVEGLDCAIIRGLSGGCSILPVVLRYEHSHCRPAERDAAVAAIAHLTCHGAHGRRATYSAPDVSRSDTAFYLQAGRRRATTAIA